MLHSFNANQTLRKRGNLTKENVPSKQKILPISNSLKLEISELQKIYDATFSKDIQGLINFILSRTASYHLISALTGTMGVPLFVALVAGHYLIPSVSAESLLKEYENGVPNDGSPSICNPPLNSYADCDEFYKLMPENSDNEIRVVQFSKTVSQNIDLNCITTRTRARCENGGTDCYTSCDKNNRCSWICIPRDGDVVYEQEACAKPFVDKNNCFTVDEFYKNVAAPSLNVSASPHDSSTLMCSSTLKPINHTSAFITASASGVTEKECAQFQNYFEEFVNKCNERQRPSGSSSLYNNVSFYAISSMFAATIFTRIMDNAFSNTHKPKLKID